MSEINVGAGILSIITESLYDNPIVVFREYVQNSVDSIFKLEIPDKGKIKIWNLNDNLYFLDNGTGINRNEFLDKMQKIGSSTKSKYKNLGYKGIGRLSGVPYCKELIFVNITDFLNKKCQIFTISGEKHEQIKNKNQESFLSWDALIDEIGTLEDDINFNSKSFISDVIDRQKYIFTGGNTGFLVILKEVSSVLKNTIEDDAFFEKLQWLLPVNFDSDLYNSDKQELFTDLTEYKNDGAIAIKYCSIEYNEIPILRPIKKEHLRKFTCKSNFNYAVGFHSFNGDKILIDKNNSFSGIRIYIDNMLLCDEKELLQGLENYGLLEHTSNGQLQSVRGVGAMVYITDKVSISANARRTFIEVMDNDSIEFLKLLAEFVNTIYDTRYDLSNYASAKNKHEADENKLQNLKNRALESLRKMAKENIELPAEIDRQEEFDKMHDSEKKRAIKRRIAIDIDKKLKEYVKNLKELEVNNAYENFISWLIKK